MARIIRRVVATFIQTYSGAVLKLKQYTVQLKGIKLSAVLFSILVLCLAAPLLNQRIMCNDELQIRFYAIQGFEALYKYSVNALITHGRIMAVVVKPLVYYLGFVGSKNNFEFRILQVVSIFLLIFLFCCFINKILRNRRFSCFCGLLMILFVPITFEPTCPNTFVAMYNYPMCLLMISFCLFYDYIHTRKRSQLMGSMLLFFAVQTTYEMFITYVVLFLMIALGETGLKKWKINLKLYICPILNSILFLVCYVISTHYAPSSYAGNQLGFDSISGSLQIIKQLFLSSLPGYFLFSPKYRFLFKRYNNLSIYNYLRVAVIIICACIICIILMRQAESLFDKKKIEKKVCIVLCGVVYIVLPCLPIAVSQLYQGSVGASGHLALPCTFFTYLAAMFAICYLLWNVAGLFGKRGHIIIAILICLFASRVQLMNDVFAAKQNEDFERMLCIEKLIQTDIMSSLDGKNLYAEDLYQTRLALAIHDGYWTAYSRACGKNITLLNKMEGQIDGSIYYSDDKVFSIITDETVYIVSAEAIKGVIAVKVNEEKYVLVQCNDAVLDQDMYVYSFNYMDDTLLSLDNIAG